MDNELIEYQLERLADAAEAIAKALDPQWRTKRELREGRTRESNGYNPNWNIT